MVRTFFPVSLLAALFIPLGLPTFSNEARHTGVSERSIAVFEQIAPFQGRPLIPDQKSYLCKANDVIQGGYWRLDAASEEFERGARVRKERMTTWRITLQGNTAQVIRFTGASQALEEPESYTVDLMSNGGLLLIYHRASGHASQVISINPENSSFVYSTHSVFHLLNRASVWYGVCIPYL